MEDTEDTEVAEVLRQATQTTTTSSAASGHRWRHQVAHPVIYVWAPALTPYKAERKEENVHEHWIEQFNDLIMVAFLSNLSHLFVSSGPHASNFWVCFQLFVLEMQSLHFVSYVFNIWPVHDVFTIALCGVVSMGSAIMGIGVGCDVHVPCLCEWAKSQFHVGQFTMGMWWSMLGQLVIHSQVVLREKRNACRLASLLGIAGCILTMLLLLVEHKSRWVCICIVHVVEAFVVLQFTPLRRFISFSHMQNRLDVMILVALGEWTIQIVCAAGEAAKSDERKSDDVLEFVMVFVSAVFFLNTRPHEMVFDVTRKRMMLFVAFNQGVQYLLGFMIFLVAEEQDLSEYMDIFIAKGTPCGTKEPPWSDQMPHGVHAFGGSGSSGRSHRSCEHITWTRYDAIMLRAVTLSLMRLFCLYLRRARKNNATGEQRIGKKLILRILGCFLHLLVPTAMVQVAGCDTEPGEACCIGRLHGGAIGRAHVALLVIDLFLELSVHKMAVQQWREWREGVLGPAPAEGPGPNADSAGGASAIELTSTDSAARM